MNANDKTPPSEKGVAGEVRLLLREARVTAGESEERVGKRVTSYECQSPKERPQDTKTHLEMGTRVHHWGKDQKHPITIPARLGLPNLRKRYDR